MPACGAQARCGRQRCAPLPCAPRQERCAAGLGESRRRAKSTFARPPAPSLSCPRTRGLRHSSCRSSCRARGAAVRDVRARAGGGEESDGDGAPLCRRALGQRRRRQRGA
jgi:hypothetical protein